MLSNNHKQEEHWFQIPLQQSSSPRTSAAFCTIFQVDSLNGSIFNAMSFQQWIIHDDPLLSFFEIKLLIYSTSKNQKYNNIYISNHMFRRKIWDKSIRYIPNFTKQTCDS